MINRKVKLRFLSMFLLAALSVNAYSQDVAQSKLDNKARKTEQKADRKFVEQDFDKAMELYESALKDAKTETYSAILHLKAARLYLTLLDYVSAIPHYEIAMQTNEDLFTSVDICNYLDALRYSGRKLEAIRISRDYAYKDIFRQDQRYLNILHALSYEDGFMPVGTPEFEIERLDKMNTPFSEFWVGKMKNEYFYATSNSRFHDPNKKFYHRTRYYSLDENSEYAINANTKEAKEKAKSKSKRKSKSKSKKKKNTKPLLHMIPIDLQNGPMSFSNDMTKMVVTEVSYDKGEQIEMSSSGINAYQTKLRYSEFDKKRKGWTAFKFAFPQQEGASYAHPFIFNNNRSILFASDMEGGYGGYDIYVVHWDNTAKQWGSPINMGPQINTEGDEICPAIYDNMLVFSSNGHVGFGGYDIYGITYENGNVLNGSLVHYDYPVNTVSNDFSMLRIDKNRGYIVSDRNRGTKDDVYVFKRNTQFAKRNNIYGMSETNAISSGAISLVNNEGDHNAPKSELLPSYSGYTSDSMLSVYFDFDKSELQKNAIDELKAWLADTDFKSIESLVIDGYADEMGTANYNHNLSKKRAEAVASWLRQQGIKAEARVTGKGSTTANGENGFMSVFNDSPGNTYTQWSHRIWLNRKARRVDIKAIIK
ncbi:MAG: OmpA family protein [Dysgonomonas sp.]|nr:OmpA family protein [Dysgonomonas sp.]